MNIRLKPINDGPLLTKRFNYKKQNQKEYEIQSFQNQPKQIMTKNDSYNLSEISNQKSQQEKICLPKLESVRDFKKTPNDFQRHFLPETLLDLQIKAGQKKYKFQEDNQYLEPSNINFRQDLVDQFKKPFIISFRKLENFSDQSIYKIDQTLHTNKLRKKSQLIDIEIKKTLDIYHNSERVLKKKREFVPKSLFS